ncbi:MAG: biotin/lipoyl-binding protein [Anaerolineae bacterium]|nr:biotin/lipoyl-binding protein [Anaerolineae bacterium]
MKYYTKVNEKEFIIEIGQDDTILVNDAPYVIDFKILPISGLASLLINNQSLEAVVEERDNHWEVLTKGELYNVHVQDERAFRLAQARGTDLGDSGETAVKAPMPGLVIKVLVEKGDVIEQGQHVIILESMKMENELKAVRGGVVTAVKTEAGASVDKDQVLIVIDDPDEA